MDRFSRLINVVVLLTACSDRLTRVATLIIGTNFRFVVGVVVAFAMHHDRRRQAHRDRAAEYGPAYRQTRDRIHAWRQRQQRRDALDMAADIADGARA